MTLGGTLIVHNATEFDFCVEAAVRSLCGVCDTVLVLNAGSTDNTRDILAELLFNRTDHCDYKFAGVDWEPNSMGAWLADLTNMARSTLHTDMHLNLQADEVLHEADYPLIRKLAQTGETLTFERLNFWLDHKHILPPHTKVGSTIVRLAPTHIPSVGDAQGLDPSNGWKRSTARIYHYGFIRDPRKWASKSREMQQAFFNTVDPIVDAVEADGISAMGNADYPTAVPMEQLVRYDGRHPIVAHGWLRNHGYEV